MRKPISLSPIVLATLAFMILIVFISADREHMMPPDVYSALRPIMMIEAVVLCLVVLGSIVLCAGWRFRRSGVRSLLVRSCDLYLLLVVIQIGAATYRVWPNIHLELLYWYPNLGLIPAVAMRLCAAFTAAPASDGNRSTQSGVRLNG